MSIFGVGLRSGNNMEMPFICYLITGIALLNFFNGTMMHGATSIRNHSFLLKK